MPRNISFFLTTEQIRNRTKTVTRRLGWNFLKVGDILNACVKCQGLKKGEKMNVLCRIRVLSVRKERLYAITKEDVIKEGFPEHTKAEFVRMFQLHTRCNFEQIINRIEFEYMEKLAEKYKDHKLFKSKN